MLTMAEASDVRFGMQLGFTKGDQKSHFQTRVNVIIQCESKNYPLWLVSIFAKRLGIFNWNFAHLLCVQIYDRWPNFIQLSPNLTKLCCIKRDYTPNFKPIVTPEYQLFDYLLVTGSQSIWLSCVGCHASGISQNSSKVKNHSRAEKCSAADLGWLAADNHQQSYQRLS